MKIRSGLVIIAGVLILGGVASGGESGSPPAWRRWDWKDKVTDEERRTHALFNVVHIALANAGKMEGRVLSLPELCASPYMPVRCSALVNPYTGKPYEWASGRLGEVSLVPEGDDFVLSAEYIDYQGDPKTHSVRLSKLFSWYVEGSFKAAAGGASLRAEEMKRRASFRRELDAQWRPVADLSPPDLAAFFVGNHLWNEIHVWLNQIKDPGAQWRKELSLTTTTLPSVVPYPLSHPREVRDLILKVKPSERLVTSYPLAFLEVYRNDFTGGVAEKVDAPSPGNYRFEVRADDSGCLVVYGSGGQAVFAMGLWGTRSEVRVDAEGKKRWIPCVGFEDWLG